MTDTTIAAPAPAPAAEAPAAAPAPAAPAAPAPAPASVLAAGAAPAPAPAPAADADPFGWLPAKHRVAGDDGAVNVEASARKLAEAYAHAEKRIGSGDLPPKTADEYKVNVPEALADKIKAEELAQSEDFKGFLGKLHEAGLTQRQVDVAVGEFLDRSLKLQAGVQKLGADEATAALRETWKTDAEFSANVQAAYKAGQTYAGADFDGILSDYGNDPRIVRLLANVGKELGEDKPAPAGAVANFQADLESLTKSPAYMNPAHPDHLATKMKVDAIFQRQYGSSTKRNGPVVIST